MGRDRSLSRHVRYGTFPLISAVFTALCVVCADLYLKLLKYCCAAISCVFVITFVLMIILNLQSACKNVELCTVPKTDSSMWNVIRTHLQITNDTFFLLAFCGFVIKLCVYRYALCLQIHNWSSCQISWSEVGLIIMVLAMSFPADCNCHSSLRVLCPWSTPSSGLIKDSSCPP